MTSFLAVPESPSKSRSMADIASLGSASVSLRRKSNFARGGKRLGTLDLGPEDELPDRDDNDPLIELVAERLTKKVAWNTDAVKSIKAALAEQQFFLRDSLDQQGLSLERVDILCEDLRSRVETVETAVRRQAEGGAVAKLTSKSSSSEADDADGELVTRRPSVGSVDLPLLRSNDAFSRELADKVEVLQREFARFEQHAKHVEAQQEQKDLAQDELLSMELDSLNRLIGSCVKTQALDEQRKMLIGKMQNTEAELHESMRALNSEFQQELLEDTKRLQEQLTKVTESVKAQIQLLDSQIRQNQESDSMREQALQAQLAKLEKNVQSLLGNMTTHPHEAEDRGSVSNLEERLAVLETRFGVGPGAAGRGDPIFGPGGLSEQVADALRQMMELASRTDNLEKKSTGRTAALGDDASRESEDLSMTRRMLGKLEDSHDGMSLGVTTQGGGDVAALDQRLQKHEGRLSYLEGVLPGEKAQLEKLRRDSLAKLEEMHQQIASLQKNPSSPTKQTNREVAQTGGDDRLAWLDERLGALAQREHSREKADLAKRVGSLEGSISDLWATMDQRISECSGKIKELNSSIDTVSTVAKGGGRQKGKVAPLSDDIWEEMQRLRCTVECLEECVPKETRKHMEFFKRAGSGGPRKGSSQMELEAQFLKLQEDMEKSFQSSQATQSHEYTKILQIVKGIEKEHNVLADRVQDLSRWHPQAIDALEAVQAQLAIEATDCTGGTGAGLKDQVKSTVQALMPVQPQLPFKKALDHLRGDLDHSLLQLRHDLTRAIGEKADTTDLTTLAGRMEILTRSQLCTPLHNQSRASDSRPQTSDLQETPWAASRTSSQGSSRRASAGWPADRTDSRPQTSDLATGLQTPAKGSSRPGSQPAPGLMVGGSRGGNHRHMVQSQSQGRLPTVKRRLEGSL